VKECKDKYVILKDYKGKGCVYDQNQSEVDEIERSALIRITREIVKEYTNSCEETIGDNKQRGFLNKPMMRVNDLVPHDLKELVGFMDFVQDHNVIS
jgi:hypothetical protein